MYVYAYMCVSVCECVCVCVCMCVSTYRNIVPCVFMHHKRFMTMCTVCI